MTASEIAKRSATFGAMVISLPLASLMAMTILYQDTKDTGQVADFAEAIVWLMLPSLMIFVVTPWMLRRDYGFEVSMAAGIVCTMCSTWQGMGGPEHRAGILGGECDR